MPTNRWGAAPTGLDENKPGDYSFRQEDPTEKEAAELVWKRAAAEGMYSQLEDLLVLEPLVDRPELFEPGYRFTEEDFADHPWALARYRTCIRNYEAQRDPAWTAEEEERFYTSRVRKDMNPLRVNKLSSALANATHIMRDAYPHEAAETLGEDIKTIDNKLEAVRKSLRHTPEGAKREFVTQEEAHQIYTIGRVAMGVMRNARLKAHENQ